MFHVSDESDEIGEVTAPPIEPLNNEGVAFTQALEAAFQLRPAEVLSAGLFFAYLTASGALECVSLQIEGLVIRRDAGVADAQIPESYQG